MGSEHTITLERVEEAAKAAGKTRDQFLEAMHEAAHTGHGLAPFDDARLEQAAKDMGNSTDEQRAELMKSLHALGHKHSGE